MLQCWSAEHEARPSVDDVAMFLQELLVKTLLASRLQQRLHETQQVLSVSGAGMSTHLLQLLASRFWSFSTGAPEVTLQDLTKHITKIGNYPNTRGGFGDIWKCLYRTDQGTTNVCLQYFLSSRED